MGGESQEHILLLAGMSGDLPPLIVHRQTMRVIDGAHRLRAAMMRGDTEIEVQFFSGSEEDAFVMAVKANVTHGLPLSLADRKAAAERIVASHPQWSDRVIASATGLAAKTVRAVRGRGDGPQPMSRIGRDGRVRPLDPADGRRRASTLLAERPATPLKEIAMAAGISQRTARDVRDRMVRGEEVVPRDQIRRRRRKKLENDGSSNAGGIDETGLDRTVLMGLLRQDPSVRFTQAGRTLLRLLEIHVIDAQRREWLLDNVPQHCRRIAAELARACAVTWQELAVRLEREGA
ncbi:ParB N-terminal domain-containing protein [Amycolatopsis sp. FU40]|uniref:ParB/RepB/Spo0J family partition protein n=1 Tax=Amycolatopsis sp. FU40 TaxID=2914159 RepID=UPI001F32ED48|nr:ParB N-terminal domain-containing protein [Amycolatopsis sp. FU40]UKD51080.1 ParB N-terminal domain-containing protein [Amycolatopsis sp. FU40]